MILYVVDTLRADSLGAYGNTTVETPHVDALAADATLFERAYAASSWTRASMATVLTGLDPEAHGVTDRFDPMPEGVTLLHEQLAARGYATGAIVTNPNLGSFFGFARGFDDYVELYGRRAPGKVQSAELVARADEVTRRAIDWLEEADRPFFLLLLTVDPHWPYAPPEGFDRYGGSYAGAVRDGASAVLRRGLSPPDRQRVRSFYWGEVAFNDHAFGELVGHLRASGLYDETVVVFTSDHGEEFWEHGRAWHGKTLFEESIRVPLLIRDPHRSNRGRRVEAPVSLVDLAPTVLDLAGVELPAGAAARSLLAPDPSDAAAVYASLDLDGYRASALISHPWKLIVDRASGARVLLDLESDPAETVDLAAERTAEIEELGRRLDARVRAAEAEHQQLLAGQSPESIGAADLPDDTRRALEELGYLEPADADPQAAGDDAPGATTARGTPGAAPASGSTPGNAR